MKIVELIGVPGFASLIAHQYPQVIVVDLFLFVGDIQKALVDRFEFGVLEVVAEGEEPGLEAVFAGVATEHNVCLGHAD